MGPGSHLSVSLSWIRFWVLLASLAGCLLWSWPPAGTKLVKWLEREGWEPPREAWGTVVQES